MQLRFILLLLPLLSACVAQTTLPGGDVIATLPPEGAAPVDSHNQTSASSAGSVASSGETVVEIISAESDLLFTITALNISGHWPILEREGPYTVLAPANVAFSKTGLSPQQMDPDDLFLIMQNHIVEGRFTTENFTAGVEMTTLAGEKIAAENGQRIAYSEILKGDYIAGNGVVHIVEDLILPVEGDEMPSMWGVLVRDGRFSQIISWLEGTDLMYRLRFDVQPDAFLAPTDAAMAAMPADIRARVEEDPRLLEQLMNYHLLTPDGWPGGTPLLQADIVTFTEISTQLPVAGSGFGSGFYKLPVRVGEDGRVQLGAATIIEADIAAKNGAVHVVDTVLVPEVVDQ